MSPEFTNAAKAALWTALFSFIGLFSVTLLGWLQEVLGYGFVAATASTAIGAVNFAVRYAQARNVLPGSGPSYDGVA